MKKTIENIFNESIQVKKDTLTENLNAILEAIEVITQALKDDKKIIFFGNGGSAADSQHIAAELMGRFQKERQSLAAIALTTDTSILTALGNDYGFDIIFARQLEGLGKKGDVAVGISTSGNSKNIIEGIKQAKKMGLKTIALVGCNGGKLASLCDVSIVIPSNVTARIQEAHICVAHTICELVEKEFVGRK